MNFSFRGLFGRPSIRPAMVQLHTTDDPPPWRRSRPWPTDSDNYKPPAHHANVVPLRRPAPAVSKLDDTKLMLRTMTYGEFMEYCTATGADPQKLWRYATGTVTEPVRLGLAA